MAVRYYHFKQAAWTDATRLAASTELPFRGGRIVVSATVADRAVVKVPNRYISLVNTGLKGAGTASTDDLAVRYGTDSVAPAADFNHGDDAAARETIRVPSGGEVVMPPFEANCDDEHVLNLATITGAGGSVQVELILNTAR